MNNKDQWIPLFAYRTEKSWMTNKLYYRFLRITSFTLLTALLTACDIINPAEEIPSYIHLQRFNLNTQFGQGSASHKITDVWVYVNDQYTGTYELPATIPILAGGKNKLQLRPGILLNGITSTRSVYPIYTSIILNVDLEPGKILYIDSISDCTITYHADVNFPWNDRGQEDFEEGGISIDSTGNSQTRITRVSDEVFEGNYSGLIELNNTTTVFEGKSIDVYNLPLFGVTTFIELNYKCNNSFIIGYISNNIQGSGVLRQVVEVFPKDIWNKMYINLTPYISIESNPINFNIWIGATKNPGVENPKIYIDNLKIVHF